MGDGVGSLLVPGEVVTIVGAEGGVGWDAGIGEGEAVDFAIDCDEVAVGGVGGVGLVDVAEGTAPTRVPGVNEEEGFDLHEVFGVVVGVALLTREFRATFTRVQPNEGVWGDTG